MNISARNNFKGRVKTVTPGSVNTEVTIELAGGIDVVSVITKQSAERLGRAAGKEVYVVIKASDVMGATNRFRRRIRLASSGCLIKLNSSHLLCDGVRFRFMKTFFLLLVIFHCPVLTTAGSRLRDISGTSGSTDTDRQVSLMNAPDQTPESPAGSASPNPKLKPEEVIELQIEALRKNDVPAPDSGIKTAFLFASPENRAATGPVERFIRLVKNPLYRPMLNHKSVKREMIVVAGDVAQQRVTITAADGEQVIYKFTLSKQQAGEYKDCWMTDGVERVGDEERQKDLRRIARNNGHTAH